MKELEITILLSKTQPISITLCGKEGTLTEISQDEAKEYGEACYQLTEGCRYEYKVTTGYRLKAEIVRQSKFDASGGILETGNKVGTFPITICHEDEPCADICFEIRSVKEDYRKDYRRMLEEIAEHCTELLMHHNSPVNQLFTPDFSGDARTLYQRFAFIRSIIDSEDFANAIHQIFISPVTCWREDKELKNICGVKKLDRQALKQIACSTRRPNLSKQQGILEQMKTLPENIEVKSLQETVDTPENRFVKYALYSFFTFCTGLITHPDAGDRLKQEGHRVVSRLGYYLNHALFKQIGMPDLLPLNSPILQRKEGYREVLRAWLMFDLAAKLVWQGGDDVYSAGKRDVARLYEYWLFFKLLHLVEEVFQLKMQNLDQLIVVSNHGLSLQLRQGYHVAVAGVYECDTRRLNVEFSYNRRFKGGKSYPTGGSWTLDMRPDYTLTIWPVGIDQEEAEREELIVHLHFDAKYKLNKVARWFDVDLEKGKKIASYPKEDIWKMHAYRDAIRRSAGAYILYPGSDSEERRGFHEILPGVGAFAVNPSEYSQGIEDLKNFLGGVIEHFLNRTSQREKMSYQIYDIHQENQPLVVKQSLPECVGENRGLFPDKTAVLVGFYKNEAHLEWIVQNGLYNARIGTRRGSVRLNSDLVDAKYLLLHTTNELRTSRLFKIKSGGPRIYSRGDLLKKNYPASNSTKMKADEQFYLVYQIEKLKDVELRGRIWDVSRLSSYARQRSSAMPFGVSLCGLMEVEILAL